MYHIYKFSTKNKLNIITKKLVWFDVRISNWELTAECRSRDKMLDASLSKTKQQPHLTKWYSSYFVIFLRNAQTPFSYIMFWFNAVPCDAMRIRMQFINVDLLLVLQFLGYVV